MTAVMPAPRTRAVTRIGAQPFTVTVISLSEPQPLDLKVYRGDTGQFRVTVVDPQGAPIDVSAAQWLSQIRTTTEATDILAEFTITPVAGDTASIDVLLTATDSAALTGTAAVWDLQMTMDPVVQTLLAGRVLITRDVSR